MKLILDCCLLLIVAAVTASVLVIAYFLVRTAIEGPWD